tara:strand:+ start:184 stop:516 length:333 start_codon:yes stop_codon:yes gene_type:complete
MNKFNESVQIEETTEFKDNEVMNELNNEQQFTSMAHKRRVERLQNDSIQVGDKVQWWGFKGDEQILFAGRVESVGEFNDVKTFTVTKFGMLDSERTQTMISASRVTKIGK